MAGRKITAMLESESCDHAVTEQSPNVTNQAQTTPKKKKALPSGKPLSDKGLDGFERSAQADGNGGGGGNRTRSR